MALSAPRRASSLATREALLAAARTLFLQRGFDAATVRSIAEGASVTVGAFYGHFESKQSALIDVVIDLSASGSRPDAFDEPAARALLLTVASLAHRNPAAAQLLRDVLASRCAGDGPDGLEPVKIASLLVPALAAPR